MPVHGPRSDAEEHDQGIAAVMVKRADDEESQLLAVHGQNSTGGYGTTPPSRPLLPSSRSSSSSTSLTPKQKLRRAVHTAARSKHRYDISEKLQQFNMNDYSKFYRSKEYISECKDKRMKEFHRRQNHRIEQWFEVDAVVRAMANDVLESFEPQDLDHDGIAEAGGKLQLNREEITALLPQSEQERRRKEARQARLAINVNVAANVLLVVAKAIATFYSSSLSLIASLTDSVLDLLMTIIIFGTAKIVAHQSTKLARRYPVGRRRLQPLGTLVFSVIMVVSFLQILQESVGRLIADKHSVAKLSALAIGSMLGTISIKGIIWFGCAWQQSSQVQALAQDCKTDVLFNTASFLFPIIGHWRGIWWLDPLGAGLLSVYIIFDWAATCLSHVNHLAGASVDHAMINKLVFLAWRFSPVVDAYKNLIAYHAGDGIYVEVDCLLEPNTDLRRAHDVAECMQYCLEGLNEVDRAFVTVDYAVQGPSGHASVQVVEE